MSTDKKEDGFVKVPNMVYDAILTQKLSITQERALLYIIRKTYGFRKTEDAISVSKMASETGFSRRAMINAIHDLEKMGIISLGKIISGRPTHMMVNETKDWEQNL